MRCMTKASPTSRLPPPGSLPRLPPTASTAGAPPLTLWGCATRCHPTAARRVRGAARRGSTAVPALATSLPPTATATPPVPTIIARGEASRGCLLLAGVAPAASSTSPAKGGRSTRPPPAAAPRCAGGEACPARASASTGRRCGQVAPPGGDCLQGWQQVHTCVVQRARLGRSGPGPLPVLPLCSTLPSAARRASSAVVTRTTGQVLSGLPGAWGHEQLQQCPPLSPTCSWMDEAEPSPICQKGSYCGGDSPNGALLHSCIMAGGRALLDLPIPAAAVPAAAAGTCIENAADCGQEGKGCCVTSTPSATNYWCLKDCTALSTPARRGSRAGAARRLPRQIARASTSAANTCWTKRPAATFIDDRTGAGVGGRCAAAPHCERRGIACP